VVVGRLAVRGPRTTDTREMMGRQCKKVRTGLLARTFLLSADPTGPQAAEPIAQGVASNSLQLGLQCGPINVDPNGIAVVGLFEDDPADLLLVHGQPRGIERMLCLTVGKCRSISAATSWARVSVVKTPGSGTPLAWTRKLILLSFLVILRPKPQSRFDGFWGWDQAG
jgi:hypothetical protein